MIQTIAGPSFGALFKHQNNIFIKSCERFVTTKESPIPDSKTRHEIARTNIKCVKSLFPYNGIILPSMEQNAESIAQTGSLPQTVLTTHEIEISKQEQKSLKALYKFGYEILEEGKDAIFDRAINSLLKISEKAPPKTENFTKLLIKFNSFMSRELHATMSAKSEQHLEKIAADKNNYIFIMNHNNMPYDIPMGNNFLRVLYKKYRDVGRASGCPLPKIMINKDIIDTMPEKLKELYLKTEALPVHAYRYPTQESAAVNKSAIEAVTNDIVNGNVNLVMYPEGGAADLMTLSREERFKYGIGKVILKVLSEKEKKGLSPEINIVSVGLTHKRNGQSAMNVGQTMTIRKENEKLLLTRGNILPETQEAQENTYFKELSSKNENEMFPIYLNGKTLELQKDNPVSRRMAARVLSGILFTDLSISEKEAKKALTI